MLEKHRSRPLVKSAENVERYVTSNNISGLFTNAFASATTIDSLEDLRGTIKKSNKLSVTIPPGVDDGYRIKLRREGEASHHDRVKLHIHHYINLKHH